MPPPHARSPTSPPADRLRVGDCVVDVPLREITAADGARTRVTLKTIAVLLVLVEHAGRVVTRETLLETVWAGTLPTLDVVTQAVAALRRAFGGDADPPGYVETIPKAGYRLLAAVEWLPKAPTPALPQPAQPRPMVAPQARTRPQRVLGATLAVAALLAVLGWSAVDSTDATRSTPPPVQAAAAADVAAYTLLTSAPGLEIDPSLSPDGASVAYAMSPRHSASAPVPASAPSPVTAIFVQSTQPGPPRQLTSPPPERSDRMPRWSPDGRQVMFVREDWREDGQDGCQLRLVPASGGMERVVGRCDRFSGARYDWLPDGSGIVAGLRPESGRAAPLSILRIDSGRWEPMVYPIAPGNVDFDPRFSPDGARLGFRRNLSRSDLWVMPAQGGPAEQVTRLRSQITGWDWAPDGRSLLMGIGNGAPRIVRHDLATGRATPLGHIPALSLDMAPQGGNLVFAVEDTDVGMFRYPLPLREGARPEQLFPSTGIDALASPSPDGRTLAFHSDRSRQTRLWIGDLDGSDRLRMVDGLVPIRQHPPQWSADGSRLLLVGEADDDSAVPGPRLYEVEVTSGRFHVVPLEGIPYFAQYLPGGRLLALVDLGSGKWSLRILGLASSPARVLAQLDDVGEARFDADSGQVFFVRIESPGLWRAGLDLAAPVRLDDREPIVYWRSLWALLRGQAMSLRNVPGCLAQWYWLGAASQAGTGCLDRGRRGVDALALVPSHDGKWLYASMSTGEENRDIGLLALGDSSGADAATR